MKKKALTREQKALLYAQLHRMQLSGLSNEQIFDILSQEETALSESARYMMIFTQEGQSVSRAGRRVGWFDGFDEKMIVVAEHSGNLTEVYESLASWYAEKAKQVRLFKSRLRFPIISLFLAFFVQPLPVLISGEISILSYTLWIMVQILLVIVLFRGLQKLPDWMRDGGFLSRSFLGQGFDRLQLSFPILGRLFQRHRLCQLMHALALMLKSGVPMFDALPKVRDLLSNRILRQQWSEVERAIVAGAPLSLALEQVGLVSQGNLAMIRTGEASGSLDASIMHFVMGEQEDLQLQDAFLACMASSLIYLLIVAWVISGIFSRW